MDDHYWPNKFERKLIIIESKIEDFLKKDIDENEDNQDEYDELLDNEYYNSKLLFNVQLVNLLVDFKKWYEEEKN